MRIYLLLMAVAAAVSFLATPLAWQVAHRLKAVTPVRDRDVHTAPTPRLGGVAIFLGLATAMVVAAQVEFLERVFADNLPWAILMCAGLICLLGVADDIFDLDWLTKLVGQVLIAGLLAWQGVQLITFPVFGLTIGSSRLSLVATVIAVVFAVNAVNWVDGLDGLAAGVIAIGGAAFFVYTYLLTQITSPTDYSNLATVVIACLVGACVGFLPHNFFPARIFMGDSGAMMLGLVISAAAIVVTGDINPGLIATRQAFPAFVPILLPLAVLMLPLLDVIITVLRRLAAGKSPFHADRKHLHHRLLDHGHSHRRTVVILYVWTAVFAASAAATAIFPVGWVILGTVVAVVLAVFISVVHLPVRTPQGWHRMRR
ncbi:MULTISPECIES: MraY family glycosyltransferase [unclassified Pseudactinotalea]|uniref:MraY family glycosyltransferase n=1 Tax=unclassified Pseudactinotalea TaxID=2649176 RepID=UPI003C7AC0AA